MISFSKIWDRILRGNRQDKKARDELIKGVNEIIAGTKYTVTSLYYNAKHFGNVLIELSCDKFTVRFCVDRSVISLDKKYAGSERWVEQPVKYYPSTPNTGQFELLFKAVEEFVAMK